MADIQIESITPSTLDGTDKVMVRRGAGPLDHTMALVDPSEFGGATDLGYTAATRVLTSSTGTDVTLPLAGSDPGLMSAADKTKLDGIEAGAQANVATDLTYTAATRVIASSTGTDATLPLVSSSDAGLAPASGGGTSNFLRADGTWAAPAGGSGITMGVNFAFDRGFYF